jgi:precorrin-6B C5,15-methyltransferase / cobalt-precorrin-6B C5,C15-methyltransferase
VAERIVVVGHPGVPVPAGADLYLGGRRLVAELGLAPAVVVGGDVGPALDAIAGCRGTACVVASGDPGFFGIVRALADRFGPAALDVRPAPSSVSLAFARLGLPWDDAVVVSAHGRPLADAAAVVARHPASPAAVLVSPESPPEALAKELLALGLPGDRPAAVCSRLGLAGEAVTSTDLDGLAGGQWDPLSVVVLPGQPAPTKTLAWGRPESAYAHRAGMITKAEVRAVALGKLALPVAGVLWDVGAGSGSVAVECAGLCPGLRVLAIERDATHLRANAAGTTVEVVEGEAPTALAGLPDPDRAFVGGGGLAVLDAVLARLRPGGVVVATHVALDRAAAAAERLGSLVQVAVSRGARLPDGGFRAIAENPVFITWGPAWPS